MRVHTSTKNARDAARDGISMTLCDRNCWPRDGAIRVGPNLYYSAEVRGGLMESSRSLMAAEAGFAADDAGHGAFRRRF